MFSFNKIWQKQRWLVSNQFSTKGAVSAIMIPSSITNGLEVHLVTLLQPQVDRPAWCAVQPICSKVAAELQLSILQ